MRDPVPVNPQEALVLGGNYYCRNPLGLRKVLTELRRKGYIVTGARFTEPRPLVAPKSLEQRCVPLWDAVMQGASLAQCLTCNGVIDPTDVEEGEGRPCEFCGTQTMQPSRVPGAGDVLVPNAKLILFWRGKIYPYSQTVTHALQYPLRTQVYEAWRWMPLSPGQELAHQVLRRVGHMHVEGMYGASDVLDGMSQRISQMGLFVTTFTTIPKEKWRIIALGLMDERRPKYVRAELLPLLTD